MHVYSPTSKVIFLVGFFNQENVLVFPSQNVQFPGLHFDAKPLVSIYDQLLECIEKYCMREDLRQYFDLDRFFAETVLIAEEEATLYVGTVKNLDGLLPRYLHTLPSLLRGMDKNRSRLVYLKALQTLTGARDQDVRAVGTDLSSITSKS